VEAVGGGFEIYSGGWIGEEVTGAVGGQAVAHFEIAEALAVEPA